MSDRETVALVARREFVEGVRSRAWRASVGIQVLVVAAIAIVAVVTGGDDGPSKRTVAVTGPEAAAIAAKARTQGAAYGIELKAVRKPTPAAARAAVRDEDADAALGPAGLTVAEDPDEALVALLQNAARLVAGEARLRAAGLDPAAIARALEPPPLRVAEVATDAGGGAGVAYIGALFLYIAILTFGYGIASSVVSEKSTRVVEVILSAIRPRQLLAGKVLGVGLLGLLQIVAVAAAGLAIALPSGAIDLPTTTAAAVALVLVYFVLGYLFYGCAYAATASLVSRQEDIQSTTAPLLVIAIAAYIATNSALSDPDGALATIGTLLPPMAPMVVPGRAAQGALPAWELALSLLAMLLAILLVVALAARIYERSVLRFGTPLKLRQALKLART